MCQACQSIAEASSAPMLYAAGFAAAATAVWTKVRPGRGSDGEAADDADPTEGSTDEAVPVDDAVPVDGSEAADPEAETARPVASPA